MANSAEKKYLAELIADFGTSKIVNSEQALLEIQSNYRTFEYFTENLLSYLRDNKDNFEEKFQIWTKILHGILFNNILNNAGEFRRSSDKGGGVVLYGPEVIRSTSGTKFQGIGADDIISEMDKLYKLLSPYDKNPIYTAIKFYQQFVFIHPFYDANGRIARFLVTVYLLYHGYYIEWKRLESTKKNEFLSKLNACHLRVNSKLYDEYLNYLYQFWKKFILKQEALEEQ